MKGGHLVKFVADTLVNHLKNPTIALIEADVWRNERSKDGNNHQAWFQLKNEYLLEQHQCRINQKSIFLLMPIAIVTL
ncbi:MAG: hypothetical protein AAF383_17410 [Cyanobacteria bacterium P01_A01_bin.83]